MSRSKETNPREFPQGMDEREKPTRAHTQPDELVRERWAWAESSAWTERMLTALEEGVKGGRWYCLMDKVLKAENLRASFAKVKKNRGSAGVDHVTVKMFEDRLDENVGRLIQQLGAGTYVPQAVKRVYIPKPGAKGKRPLGIPTVRDRVAHGALRHVLEPIFERDFAEHSYGFRPGRGCKDALRRVSRLLDERRTWVLDADIQSYFDTIPHERLLVRIRQKVTDRSVLGLVKTFLEQGVMDGVRHWRPEEGTPQGAVLSPLLANIYLDPLDHLMAEQGYEMVRYADDFVVLCASEAEARRALDSIRAWTDEAGLTLHPDKTRIVDARQRGGFDYLGYHFERGYKWPRKKSLKKLKDAIREKTRRCNGQSLDTIIERINPTLRGWFEYFKHSHLTTFPNIDGWVRMRLRSILRKRRKGKGRGRGADHQRWPNAYFAARGLFSLAAARETACQSARR